MTRTKHFLFPGRVKIFFLGYLSMIYCINGLSQAEAISSSIEKRSFVYAVKDTSHLGLDIYIRRGSDTTVKKPVVVFVFGGAFITGRRDDTLYNRYFNSLADNNNIVVSISYRLGMKGVKHVSKFNTTPLRNAIQMAEEDVYDATGWIINHAGEFGIDTSKIILSGSSSGAITILQSEYDRMNKKPSSNRLPSHFNYAGTISFSGAILSYDWGLHYQQPPAPALMFHGTGDQIVPFNKIGFLNKGFYGSGWIAKIYKKKNYPYYLYSEQALGHEVSVLPMYQNLPLIQEFIEHYIIEQRPLQTNFNIYDPAIKPMMLLTPEELLKKLQQ